MLKLKSAFLGALVSFMSIAVSANAATGPDFSSLTGAVDFSTIIAAVLLIAAGLAGLDLIIKGAKVILSAIRGR